MADAETVRRADVVVIGAGQAGLAVGYYLRRTGLSFVLLDARAEPGGAWGETWPSLRLFSPAQWSSLPGWLMPSSGDEYPGRDAVIGYLAEYERRYALTVERPVRVTGVRREGDALRVETDRGTWVARAVVSATGTWAHPVRPVVAGSDGFCGTQLHSAHYRGPEPFRGRRLAVVGGGNSGAQIAAELADVADVCWVTREPPRFLPDDVDGRVLFGQATEWYRALREGRPAPPLRSLGDIVAVPAVRAARVRGVLEPLPMFEYFEVTGVVWPNGTYRTLDAVIWATGYRPALGHLRISRCYRSERLGANRGDEGDRRAATLARRVRRLDRVCLGNVDRCRAQREGDGRPDLSGPGRDRNRASRPLSCSRA